MMNRSLQKLFRLSLQEWLTLGEIAAACLWTEIGLRVLPIERLVRLSLRVPLHRVPPTQTHVEDVMRLARVVFRRAPLHLTCLTRSLILGTLLARRGVPVELKLGVAKMDGALHAHAWLQRHGLVIADHPEIAEQFQPILSLPLPRCDYDYTPGV